MNTTEQFDNPAWPPIADEAHRPAFVHSGKIHRNRYSKPGPIANTTGLIVPKTQPAPPGASSNPPGGPETPAEESWWKSWGSGLVHIALDVAGMVPLIGEVADLTNAAIYAAEGDYVNASLSAAAAIPFAGWAATGAKAGMRVTQAVGTRVAAKGGAKATGEVAQQAGRQASPPKPSGSQPPVVGSIATNPKAGLKAKPSRLVPAPQPQAKG